MLSTENYVHIKLANRIGFCRFCMFSRQIPKMQNNYDIILFSFAGLSVSFSYTLPMWMYVYISTRHIDLQYCVVDSLC